MSGYLLTGDAEADLASVLAFMAEDSVESALRVHERLIEVFRMLSTNPYVGHLRTDLASRPVRFFPVYSYMVVYLADTNPVEIVRILGMAQDAQSILR